MNDYQRLIDEMFPFVDELLKDQGEFYPLGTTIKEDGEMKQMIIHDGDEFPLSETVIESLKTAGRKDKARLKSIAIFYDVKVSDPKTNEKSDAVAVHVESKYEAEGFIFFYPYTLSENGKLEYSSSWKRKIEREIF